MIQASQGNLHSMTNQAANSGLKPKTVSLPKIQLPNFHGDLLKWQGFWDVFQSSVHDQDLPNVMKFNYLKSTLRGPAATAIAEIPVTNDTYDVAIRTLREKLGKRDAIVQSLYTALQQLSKSTNRFQNVKRTPESVEKLLRQLEAQGERVNDQRLLIQQLVSKFPVEVVTKLEEKKGATNSWTIPSLREALLEYVTVQDNAQRHLVFTKAHVGKDAHEHETQPVSAEALATTTTRRGPQKWGNTSASTRPPYPCVFCGSNHMNENCDQHATLKGRKQRLLEQEHCFVCLKTGHTFRDCPCHTCGSLGHHNRSLCPKRWSDQRDNHDVTAVVTDASEAPRERPTSVNTNTTQALAYEEKVLLQTATVDVCTDDALKNTSPCSSGQCKPKNLHD